MTGRACRLVSLNCNKSNEDFIAEGANSIFKDAEDVGGNPALKGVTAFRRILVALDSSAAARKALDIAIDLARGTGAKLWGLSVIPIPEFGGTVGEVTEVKEEGEKHFGPVLQQARDEAERQGVELEAKILYGHPAETIVSFATKGNFDLIVIGYKGSSGVKRFLLGGTSDKVSHYSPCSVLLVK